MAKKAPSDEPPFSPVKSRLVHAVLSPQPSSHPLPGAPAPPGGVSLALRHAPRLHRIEAPIREAGGAFRSLTREKRVLISECEETALDELVRRLASSGATSLKLSHLMRACIVLLRHSESEIVECFRRTARLVRPPNGSGPALAVFERMVAQQIASAIKEGPPFV